MIIKTLKELQQPDDASLMFSPLGIGGRMRPEQAAEFQQRVIAQYTLTSQVPEATRKSFERAQTIYSYGVLCYELYTVAGDQAKLAVEQALRDRFLPFYENKVRFVDGRGQPQTVETDKFDALYKAIRKDDGRSRRWQLQLASSGQPIEFNGELTSLLRWARAEGLLDGQRDRIREPWLVRLRNLAAHPSYHLGMPADAERDIADLAAIINRLWGAPTGAPVAREVMVVGWDHRTVMSGLAAHYDTGPLGESAVFVIVRGDPRDDFGSYDTRYETTSHPCEYLWGPGSWPDAKAWLERERPQGDEAVTLDRLFMLGYRDRILTLAQNVQVAAGLGGQDTEGTWYLIRADSPVNAFSHQRQALAAVPGHKAAGPCLCPVETLGEGAWGDVLRLASTAGTDVTPRAVPDARVTISRMPRCNEIVGNGSWTIPDICW